MSDKPYVLVFHGGDGVRYDLSFSDDDLWVLRAMGDARVSTKELPSIGGSAQLHDGTLTINYAADDGKPGRLGSVDVAYQDVCDQIDELLEN